MSLVTRTITQLFAYSVGRSATESLFAEKKTAAYCMPESIFTFRAVGPYTVFVFATFAQTATWVNHTSNIKER